MELLLSVLGPWGLLVLGILIGLVGVGIPLMIRQSALQVRLRLSEQAAHERAEASASLSLQMQSVAAEALRQNREDFLSMAGQTLQQQSQNSAKDLEKRQEGIDALLRPLKESVDLYRRQTQAEQGALKQELANLTTLGQDMTRQAAALRSALTSSPRGAGAWGEQQLKNIMTMAGMAEHVDFDLQAHVTGEGGAPQRPDARINLPGGGSIIVDAKAPLDAYLASHDLEGAAAQARLNDFVQALRGHVMALKRKAYWAQFEPSPEFTVLFLPNDSMLMTAFDQQPSLLEWALNQKVILASPSTLIALLTTVAYSWRQDSLAHNSREIADLGKKLYEALATLGEHFDKVGKNIERSAKAYNAMIGSVERTVMPRARRFRDLQMDPGAKTLGDPSVLSATQVERPRPGRDLQVPEPEVPALDSLVVDQPSSAQSRRRDQAD